MRRYAIVLAAFAISLSACGGTSADPTADPTTAPGPVSSTTPQLAATTTSVPAIEPSATTVADAGQITSGSFAVPFLLAKPEGTRFRKEATADAIYLQVASGDNAYFIITTRGPDTIQDWKNTLADQPISISAEPVAIDIGGIAAAYFEFTVQDRHAAPGELAFTFEPGDTGRVYSLEIDGEPVMILAVAGPDPWTSFEAVVDQLTAGLTWK